MRPVKKARMERAGDDGGLLLLAGLALVAFASSGKGRPGPGPGPGDGTPAKISAVIGDISVAQNVCMHLRGTHLLKAPGDPVIVSTYFGADAVNAQGVRVSWVYRTKVKMVHVLPAFPDDTIATYRSAAVRFGPESPHAGGPLGMFETPIVVFPDIPGNAGDGHIYKFEVELQALKVGALPVDNDDNWRTLDDEVLEDAIAVRKVALSAIIGNITVAQQDISGRPDLDQILGG